MKDELLQKLKDFINFLIFIAIVIVIARMTGLLEGFAPQDFSNAFSNITTSISNGKVPSNFRIKNGEPKVNGYRPAKIPEGVFTAGQKQRYLPNLFNNNKKVIFYIYGQNDSDFHSKITSYMTSNNAGYYYKLMPYSSNLAGSFKIGADLPSHICNSLQECNEYRKKSTSYNELSVFLQRCGKTMCIINSRKQQYITLKTRDYNAAYTMLNALKNW